MCDLYRRQMSRVAATRRLFWARVGLSEGPIKRKSTRWEKPKRAPMPPFLMSCLPLGSAIPSGKGKPVDYSHSLALNF